MSTSAAGGRVLNGALADYSEADEPVDTGFAAVTVNNYLHWADMAGQVRVAWNRTNDGGSISRGSRVSASVSSSVFGDVEDSEMHPMWIAQFPVTVRSDGSSYGFRTFVVGSSLNATSTSLRIAIAPIGRAAAYIADPAGHSDATLTSTTSSTTSQLLMEGLLFLTADEVAQSIRTQQTIDGVAGDPVGVRWAWVECAVWGSGTDLDPAIKSPLIQGVMVAEVLPP